MLFRSVLEARPVYEYVSARMLKVDPDPTEMWLGFGGAALVSLTATFLPIRMAVQRMRELER